MQFLKLIALSLALLAPAYAADPPWQSDAPALQSQGIWFQVQSPAQPVAEAARNAVEIMVPTGGGSANKGSGVYLGERLVASAYHVVRDTSGNGTAKFQDGTSIRFRTISADKVWDQVVLELESEHPSLAGVELAVHNPRAGEMLYSAGFARGFRIFGGRMTGTWGAPGGRQSQTTDWFEHENPAIPGDSGGPVFNEAGQLIGCLWGTDGRHTIATGCGRFHLFVKPLFPRLAQWRANRIANQIQGISPAQCGPGGCPPQQYGGGGVNVSPGYGTPTPVQPSPPVQPAPQCPPVGCECDPEQIMSTLLERMAADERFRGPAGVAGKDGADGKDGVDGADGEINADQLAAVTQSILQVIREDDRFRGPRGERGPAGDAATLDVEALAADILSRVKHPSQRVVLLDGKSGRVIDDETYQPGEPIVLDFQAIIRSASAANARASN